MPSLSTHLWNRQHWEMAIKWCTISTWPLHMPHYHWQKYMWRNSIYLCHLQMALWCMCFNDSSYLWKSCISPCTRYMLSYCCSDYTVTFCPPQEYLCHCLSYKERGLKFWRLHTLNVFNGYNGWRILFQVTTVPLKIMLNG